MQAATEPAQPANAAQAAAEAPATSSEAPEAVPVPAEAAPVATEPVTAAVDSTMADPSPSTLPAQANATEASSTPSAAPAETPAPAGEVAANGPVPASAPAPDLTRQDSKELDAAIAATLAMDSEPAPAPDASAPSAEQTQLSAPAAAPSGGAPAASAPEPFSRDATGTPTLYQAAASASDVPGAVSTPPASAAAPNGNAEEISEPQQQQQRPPAAGSGTSAARTAGTSSLSRVAQLTARIEKDPLDGEAHLALLQDAESKGDLERTREVYERFLSVFPDAVSSLPGLPSVVTSLGTNVYLGLGHDRDSLFVRAPERRPSSH